MPNRKDIVFTGKGSVPVDAWYWVSKDDAGRWRYRQGKIVMANNTIRIMVITMCTKILRQGMFNPRIIGTSQAIVDIYIYIYQLEPSSTEVKRHRTT